ncbi:MAG: RsmB/NOP family class I SAM-dependent RNA methyltransferase [Ottowia sp.]|nr:RsmB/NOP family class I SAM-dependent RNA methyltransferase [Ottowia sp.]
MTPQNLLKATCEVLTLALRFERPADATLTLTFRQQRAGQRPGQRERAVMAETLYAVLRRLRYFDTLARSGTGGRERRLAILGWGGDEEVLRTAITPQEWAWRGEMLAQPLDNFPDYCRHNLPDWLADTLRRRMREGDVQALAAALQQEAPLDVRVNTLQAGRDAIAEELRGQGLEVQETPHSPWGLRLQGRPALHRLDAFERGDIEVQDEGAQLLALLVGARRGDMVADYCAGAGGKTLALGAMMRGTGRLYAFDISARRLSAFTPRLSRSGLSNVYPIAITGAGDQRVRRLAGKIARVLVDAPCSGLGTLRRNPDMKWRQSPEKVKALVQQQREILASAARLVQPGGRLVYATCSLLREENEDVAAAFEAAHPQQFAPVQAVQVLATAGVPAAGKLCGDGGRFLQLAPHTSGTDGFFAAVWQRV